MLARNARGTTNVNPVKLSICIPTYNRAPFLNKALGYFIDRYKFNCDYEIVISDNASTDDTRAVVEAFITKGLPIRYYRQIENIGYEKNLGSAFRHAAGDYIVYLADDDILISDEVSKIVTYMETNTDIVACYAPWFIHDEVNIIDHGTFYNVSQNTKFKRGQFAELFSFIIDNHVFPEMGVYRTSTLRAAWTPRSFCYWAFAHLAHYVDQGAVAFLQSPFYRVVTVSRIARDRPQAGDEEAMIAWDRYRGGLEYLLHTGKSRGKIAKDTNNDKLNHEKIHSFTLVRMIVAMRLWAQKKDYIKAYELYTRISASEFNSHPTVQAIKQSLTLLVAVQTLAWLINASAEIDHLILHGVADLPALEALLREMGLSSKISIHNQHETLPPHKICRAAVFVPAVEDRDFYISLGHPQNIVFCEDDIVKHVTL